jgi:catechol 2,3-dioxygenase-like lactoylglutathione lyase family enzyme
VIDHVTIRVSDFAASKAFYSTVLAPLGYELAWEDAEKRLAEWGDFSIAEDGKPLTEHLHVAFAARDNAAVDEFHRVALGAGYRDNGAPGERRYHPGYYGAFVLDPDGNNVEAVCHNRD